MNGVYNDLVCFASSIYVHIHVHVLIYKMYMHIVYMYMRCTMYTCVQLTHQSQFSRVNFRLLIIYTCTCSYYGPLMHVCACMWFSKPLNVKYMYIAYTCT